MKLTIEKAIELLVKEYEKVKDSKYVRDPIAYALYHTWKKVDERRDSNSYHEL